MSKQFTKAEVAQYKDDKAMYIIVDDGVYDIAGMCFSSPFFFLKKKFSCCLFT